MLDAGCGTGSLAVEAAQRGAEVVAIDVAGSLVSIARERAPASKKERIVVSLPLATLPPLLHLVAPRPPLSGKNKARRRSFKLRGGGGSSSAPRLFIFPARSLCSDGEGRGAAACAASPPVRSVRLLPPPCVQEALRRAPRPGWPGWRGHGHSRGRGSGFRPARGGACLGGAGRRQPAASSAEPRSRHRSDGSRCGGSPARVGPRGAA